MSGLDGVVQTWYDRAAMADGLTREQSRMVARLGGEYQAHMGANSLKLAYYNDDIDVSQFDGRIPDDLKKVSVRSGACAKAVNMLARRSIFDGCNIEGESPINALLDENGFGLKYASAAPSELIFGFGCWTVSPAYDKGDPAAVINWHDPLSCAIVWDYRKNRVRYGMVIEDMDRKSALSPLEPTVLVVHTDSQIIEMSRDVDDADWTVDVKPNPYGEPLMVCMSYQRGNSQLGKSRVSETMRSLQVQHELAIYNLMAHDMYAAIPTKWLLGLSDAQFDALSTNEKKLDAKSILLGTLNEEGGTPTAGMWAATGVAEHTQVLENIAQRMAAESDLPLSAFGVLGSTYTSSDALNASSHDLVILCDSMNRSNRDALIRVFQMALCVADPKGRSHAELTDAERAMTVHFADPSMLSASQVADAMLKISSTVEGFGGTDVCLERLGFDEDERRRIQSQLATSKGLQIASSVFGA